MSQQNSNYSTQFTKPINRVGKIIIFLAIVFSFLPALWLWFYFGLFPGWSVILYGWLLMVATYGLYAIIEPISYFPTLGLPGTYLSFMSGNISNMRLPAAAVSQDVLGVEQGSKKAEIVTTLAISSSILLNLVVITIGAIFGQAILGAMPPIVVDAFAFVSPAIFGAMMFMMMSSNLAVGLFGIGIGYLYTNLLGFLSPIFHILLTIFTTIAFAWWWGNRNRSDK